MNTLVISTSLSASSRSLVLARRAHQTLLRLGAPCDLIDLRDLGLPLCDGGAAYGHGSVKDLAARIAGAAGVLLTFPVYNYAASSAAKNLLELTGDAWNDKVVGLLYTGGGHLSYMAQLGLANALMLDFRCVIVPRFVYSGGDGIAGDQVTDPELVRRIDELAADFLRISAALARAK